MFEPYKGTIEGIEPTVVKQVLYITTGELRGKVAHTLKGCDYQLVFQGSDGKEQNIIRCRHFNEETENEREEIIAIADDLTMKVNKGELLVGLYPNDCIKITDNKFY